MRDRRLYLRHILVLVTGALTLIILLLAARDMYANWLKLVDIEALQRASNLSDQLFDATEKLSVERDVALSMLQAPDAEPVDNLRARLNDSRKAADTAFAAAMNALDRYAFPELAAPRDGIAPRLAAIRNLRPEIDAVTLSVSARDPKLARRWSDEVTALMAQTDDLWTGFVQHFADVDPIVTQHLWFKRFLHTITDYTGRERSLIGQAIAENSRPSAEQMAVLEQGQGIVALSWQTERILAGQSGLYGAVGRYYSDAYSHYSTMHDMIQGMIYGPQDSGAPYPIGVDLWFELSTEASDSMGALRDAAIHETRNYVDGLTAATKRGIAWAAGVFFAALVLSAYSFWIVLSRVIRPIDTMVRALSKTMRGEPVSFAVPTGRHDEIGKLANVLYAFRQSLEDVRKTSVELDRSQSRLRAVVEHALDGLITLDVNGLVQNFNAACERIFGYAAADIVGQSFRTLMAESSQNDLDAYLLRSLGDGAPGSQSMSRELTAKRKDGSIFPVELSLSAFTLEGGPHFSGIVRDITLRKEAEREILHHTHALERSNKELDDFAYIASHDLKEPLRGIHNHSRFLLEDNEGKLDKESTGRLHRLVYLSQRMERLVNDLLYFSRLGRQELAVQSTDVGALIRDIESTLDVFLDERHATISVPRPLPLVVCDQPRVTELFRNLITNAVKYNDKPEKLVEIGCLVWQRLADGAMARQVFYVRDNGRGIDPEFHQEIFRIFKRLQAGQENEEGTGVGLTFVKKIVERHGGRIWLESEPGDGATFYFTLEAARDETRSDDKAA